MKGNVEILVDTVKGGGETHPKVPAVLRLKI